MYINTVSQVALHSIVPTYALGTKQDGVKPGDRKLDRDSHSHSRNNLIGRTCENVIHEWILSKRRGSLVTDLLSKKRELFTLATYKRLL